MKFITSILYYTISWNSSKRREGAGVNVVKGDVNAVKGGVNAVKGGVNLSTPFFFLFGGQIYERLPLWDPKQ